MPLPSETATQTGEPPISLAPTGEAATGEAPTGEVPTGEAATGEAAILLPQRSRRIRMIAAVVIFALITLGTVHGGDDAFPFGPLRMYATRDNPNGVVQQGVVQAVTRSGRVLDVTNTSGAPRRAELEGRMSEFTAHPDRFAAVAAVFVPHGNSARADPVITIRLVRRGFPLHDGRSGPPVDVVVATWNVQK